VSSHVSLYPLEANGPEQSIVLGLVQPSSAALSIRRSFSGKENEVGCHKPFNRRRLTLCAIDAGIPEE